MFLSVFIYFQKANNSAQPALYTHLKLTKTRKHSEIKQTGSSTKQDISGEALSKQNTEA